MRSLILAFLLSLYGLLKIFKYTSDVSKNIHLLHISCALIAATYGLDIIEHASYYNAPFWHHMHLFASVAAFYFLYRFASTFSITTPLDPKNALAQLGMIAVVAIPLSILEEPFLKQNYPFVLTVIYFLMIGVVILFFYLLTDIVKKTKKAEGQFSLKSLSLGVTPVIATTLLFSLTLGVVAEYVDNTGNASLNALVFPLLSFNNLLIIVVAMSVVWFGYMAEKVANFYAPIKRFISSKKPAA